LWLAVTYRGELTTTNVSHTIGDVLFYVDTGGISGPKVCTMGYETIPHNVHLEA